MYISDIFNYGLILEKNIKYTINQALHFIYLVSFGKKLINFRDNLDFI